MGIKKLKKVILIRNKNAAYYDKKLKKLKNILLFRRELKGLLRLMLYT